jgi:peptidoglycan/LPS O-acetylase OafA/YrhL
MSGNRILMFDILRIAAIVMIVIEHMGQTIKAHTFLGNINFGNGTLGVAIFLIISGSVLELTYGKKIWGAGAQFDYNAFIKKRLIRIYPAYWFSLLLALLFGYYTITSMNFVHDFIYPFTGFYSFIVAFRLLDTLNFSTNLSASPFPMINGVGWFIGTIICLYIIYPILSKFLKKNGFQGFFLVFLFAIFVRLTIPDVDSHIWYWFPLSRIAEFAFGIYIVQIGLYFKTITTSYLITVASDMSYPVFLIHMPILYILIKIPSFYNLNIVAYVCAMMVLASIIYLADPYLKQIAEKIVDRILSYRILFFT